MDRAAGRASRPRKPHERVRALQASAHRRRAHHQTLQGRSLGGYLRGTLDAAGSFYLSAGFITQSLGTPAALAATIRLETNLPPSGIRHCVSGQESGALRLARQTPRSPHNRAKKKDGLVGAELASPFPVARFATGVRDSHDLNISKRAFPINQSKRKLSKQELASVMRASRPTLGSPENRPKRAINFSVELPSSVWTALKVPVKR